MIYFRCTKVTRVVRCSKSFFALWTCKYVYVYTVMLVERKKRANTLSRVQWCSLWIKCRVELLKCGTVNADTKLACTSDCATSPVSSSPPLSFPFNMTINLHFDVWFSHFLHKNIQVQLVLLKYIYICCRYKTIARLKCSNITLNDIMWPPYYYCTEPWQLSTNRALASCLLLWLTVIFPSFPVRIKIY